MITSPTISQRNKLHRAILRWYDRNGRDLPWRHDHDPYRILVSEIMLQQTQVSRVLELYPRFLKRFPTFRSLAQARPSSVIRAWRGMGYNNRALRLQQTAKIITRDHAGSFPKTIVQLQELPGIGRYTAHALACFILEKPVAVVDTNIVRVLSRLFPKSIPVLSSGKPFLQNAWIVAGKILPRNHAYRWNQALMDLGAMLCTASNPRCDHCPVVRHCPSSFRVQRRVLPKRMEPGRDGIPNRIYRGRVVEILRYANGDGFLSFTRLAKQVKANYRDHDRRWLLGVLEGLVKDGLIEKQQRGRNFYFSLPR